MNNNVDIFISTHKNFDKCPDNHVYKLVSEPKSPILDKPNEVIYEENDYFSKMQAAISEGSRLHYIYKHYPLKDFIGSNQYRKYFSFYNDVPDIEELFKTYDVILPKPYKLIYNFDVYEHYKYCHNIDDMELCKEIIKDLYGEEILYEFNESLQTKYLFIGNMFIMTKQDFIEWCEFVFPIIKRFCELHNFKTQEDIDEYINSQKRYKKCPINLLTYQNRILGFLLERLSHAFHHIKYNHPDKKILMYKIYVTEDKIYETKNGPVKM